MACELLRLSKTNWIWHPCIDDHRKTGTDSLPSMDGVNGYGWYLRGGREYWLKGQIPKVSWIYQHSLNFHIYQITSFVPRISWSLCGYYKWWGGWEGWWEVFCVRIWMKEQGMYIIFFLFLFCFCAVVNCSFMSDAW